MRLQLTVQRHGLPPVQVLWTLASVVRPPLVAAGNSITISQFLEQVNDVLPLESEDWGLEDYSVEVRGFECLHFSELSQVLKEDDEVSIRPLQTQDLRFRKISGRHQIAADGRHLIDGVAFGRPFLRRADRPAIRIPPRKRRRITYGEEDDIGTQEICNDRQLIIRAGFENVDDIGPGDESDGDEDFAPDDEDEDLDAELNELQHDLGRAVGSDGGISQDDTQPQRITRSHGSPKGLGLLELLDDDGRPFVGEYNNPLLDLYAGDDPPARQSNTRLRKPGPPDLTRNASEDFRSILRGSPANPQCVSRRDSAGSSRSVRFETAEPATPATIRESEESEDADDGDFQLGEVDESDKENAEPQNEETESSDSFFEGSQLSSSSSSDVELSDDETSSSGSSSSSSSSGSEPELQPRKNIAHKSETSETSSSGTSSSRSSDSEPETAKTGRKRKRSFHAVQSDAPPDRAPPVVAALATTSSAAGNGTALTRRRNQRRKESKKLQFFKSKGILPAAANKSDLRKFEEGTSPSEREEMIAVGGVRAAFEAKRRDLLMSITAGGVDVTLDPSLDVKDNEPLEGRSPMGRPLSKAATIQGKIMIEQPTNEEISGTLQPHQPSANDPANSSIAAEVQDSTSGVPANAGKSFSTQSMSTTQTAIVPDSVTARSLEAVESLANDSRTTPGAIEASKKSMTMPVPEPQHRRSKLDVPGAKRMLFGSLGLRTPKTKDEEMKMREKLMKDVRPIKEPFVPEKTETVDDIAAAAEDESWKDKIDLRAVECCYEGIELSTPPFPFVQRWDPQQQRGYSMANTKKRKGKKRKRNNNDYYEDDSLNPIDKATVHNSQIQYENDSFNRKNKVVRLDVDDWRRQEAESDSLSGRANAESNDLGQSHEERFEDSTRANEQLLHEHEDASANTLVNVEEAYDLANDLPTLSEDISVYSSLTLETATRGNIIAFKQLEMSAETNWQPKISEHRTAVINETFEDGTLLMKLAKRDRASKNVQYDEQTGERLFSKFEMPGYHDENSEDKNGTLEISFDELIGPILVRAASEQGNAEIMLQGQDHKVAHTDSIDKAVTEEAHEIDADPQDVSHDGSIRELSNNAAAESSEGARLEISELIRDAGWRSSIDHELTDRQDEDPAGQGDHLHDATSDGPSSPKFHGFSSSPLTNGFQVASSPPPAAIQPLRHVHASGSESAESVSSQPRNNSPTRSDISNRRSPIDYPDLPQINDDSEVFQQEAQDRSGLPDANHQIASQDLTSLSSIRRSPSPGIGSLFLTSPERSSQKPVRVINGAESDESLPELFSQAFEKRMSQGKDIKSEESELSEKDKSISPPNHRKFKRNGSTNSSQRESGRDWKPDFPESEDEDEDEETPRQSQTGFSSQIVDLTISSDTVDPPDDSYVDDDSYVLPKGPGWVQKAKKSEPRNGLTKRTTRARGSTRSR